MSYLFRCFLLSLFMAGTFHVSAQDYASKMKAIKAKTIEAANQRDFSLYLKLAYEEYNLTYQHRDTPAMVRACVNLVDYYISGELNSDSANLYIRRGRYLTSLKKDPEHELALKYMQANLYTKTGKYVQAYVLFKSMDSLVTKSNYDFAPYYNNAYADLLLYLKKDKEAIARTKMAAALFKKSKLLQDESMTYMNIAGLYFGGNEIDSVLLYLNKAIKINEALHDTFAIAECYTRLGLIYTRQGLRKEAIGYYKLAFDLTPRHPSSQLITNYANVLMSEGRFKEAEDMLAHLIEDENVDNQLAGMESMITLREKEGRYKEALALSKQYNKKNQELLDVEKVRQVEELRTKYDVAGKENQIALLHERNLHQAKTLFQSRIILYVSVGLLLMALFAVFLIFRNRAIRLKAEQILLEWQLLRSQMDPHFIFNCLTNIQSIVLQKEYLKAASYIAVFSKLVRNILESSTQSKVVFSNEIAALKDYLALQKIRYNDRFEYEITIDEAIEEDMISIPPMLFQPIVENAIEHGIADKSNGFINIHFQQHDRHVQCTVTDNGVGYGNKAVAAEPAYKKTSLSTQITKRRLVILSKYLKQTLNYTITVLYSKIGEIAGTKVEIDIPILS